MILEYFSDTAFFTMPIIFRIIESFQDIKKFLLYKSLLVKYLKERNLSVAVLKIKDLEATYLQTIILKPSSDKVQGISAETDSFQYLSTCIAV